MSKVLTEINFHIDVKFLHSVDFVFIAIIFH